MLPLRLSSLIAALLVVATVRIAAIVASIIAVANVSVVTRTSVSSVISVTSIATIAALAGFAWIELVTIVTAFELGASVVAEVAAMIRRWHTGVEFLNEVCPTDAAQYLLDSSALLGFIPEEELALCEFLARSLGAEHRFQSIRVVVGSALVDKTL